MKDFSTSIKSERQLALLAKKIAKGLKGGEVIGLTGGLGAGKTTFVRYLVKALAPKKNILVQSPTFGLIHQYATRPPIAHFDLYRLPEKAVLETLETTGFRDFLDGKWLVLMEWSDRLPPGAVRFDGEVHFGFSKEGSRREVRGAFSNCKKVNKNK